MSGVSADPRITCDRPLGLEAVLAHNELVLSGLATSPVGISGVTVQIEDRVWNASYGLDTPADASDPELPNAGRAGYHLRIDTSSWSPQAYYVTVAAFDHEGGRSAIEGPVEVLPFDTPLLRLESAQPTERSDEVVVRLDPPLSDADTCYVNGPLRVSGWAYAASGVEKVLVTIDDRIQREALTPIVRPDLLTDFGPTVAVDAGFALLFDWAECPPGDHALSVVAFGRDGERAGCESTVKCLSPPRPERGPQADGIQWLEDAPRPRANNPEEQRLPRDELHATALMWEDRALLAEADAAVSRAELEFARASLEKAAKGQH